MTTASPVFDDRAYRVTRDFWNRFKKLVPFGVTSRKPRHFRDMFKIIWENRDNLPYAWKVITRGVCDGCALGVAGLYDWTISGPHLCMTRLNLLRLNTMEALDIRLLEDLERVRGWDNRQLRKLGRLPYPMIREKNEKGFRRISWDEAYDRMAARIQKTDPKRLAFFVTARGVTNEVYYMAQKVARFLGTSHIDNAARICHSPSTVAMKATLGVSASTCSYKDWYGTDLIIFFGSNPANDQPVSTKYLHEAKVLGTKIVLVNPYQEPGMMRYWVPSTASSAVFGSDLADYWYPVRQGGDIAFLSGVIKILIEEGWIDRGFVDRHVTGFEELEAQVKTLDVATLEKDSGLPWAAMRGFAEMIRDAKNAVLVWSMGITQHPFGTDAVQMILNLGLIRGYVGREKCGLMPIRGHSSVQGGAEMGAYTTALPGGKPLTPANIEALEKVYQFPIPTFPALTTTEMVEAGGRGQLDLLYCVGGNLYQNLPNPERVKKSLETIPLRVHQDILFNDQMMIPAAEAVILLPAKTRYEQDDGGIETTTERRIAFSPEIPRQVGEAKAEWKILREMAMRAKPSEGAKLGCETGWKLREEIAAVVPFYEGIQHLRKTGDALQYGGSHLCPEGRFETEDRKGHLRAVALPDRNLEEGFFWVSTRRGKQFNSLIYAEIDPLNGAPRDAILMNGEDALTLGLMGGDRVTLKSENGTYQGSVFIAPIARRNLQVHWPEGNILISSDRVDVGGKVPDYNAKVQIEK